MIEHPAHGLTLVDLKTQNAKSGRGPSTYRSWGYQLAAYRAALPPSLGSYGETGARRVTCMNLVVNSREPHPPVEAHWSQEQMARCWKGFNAALTIWRIERNYNPVG